MRKLKQQGFDKNLIIGITVASLFLLLCGFMAGRMFHYDSNPSIDELRGNSSQAPNNIARKLPSRAIECGKSFNVTARVDGDLLINSTVFLFELPGTDFSTVMERIRNETPIRQTTLNAKKKFEMKCIPSGHYAFVIPTFSYNGFVGSPLPYEWTRENYTLMIAFQGGDPSYSVGAFSITKNDTGTVTDY